MSQVAGSYIVSATSQPSSGNGRRGVRMSPYLFLSPYLIVTTIFFIYPLLHAMILAFYQTSGPKSKLYVGLENFRFVLSDPDFYTALYNTIFFTIASLLVQLPLSLGLAMLLNSRQDRTKSFFRLAIFSPNLVGQVFVGILFTMLFTQRYGLFNQFLQTLVGWGLDTKWLSDPRMVMPAIVIASLWLYVGFNMIYFLAALQNVDQSLIEAARMDGASPIQTFINVTLPSIKHVATFVIITSTIGSFQLFELPYTLLDQGFGPNNSGLTIVGYLYKNAFDAGDLGTAAAVGWVLTMIILAINLVQLTVSKKLASEE